MTNRSALFEEIKNKVKGNYCGLALFGSYARGDQGFNSDVDVLQLLEKRMPAYSVGKFNFSVYYWKDLEGLAKKGNLFVLHVIRESVTIKDHGCLQTVKNSFNQPFNYSSYREELKEATKLVDISLAEFTNRKKEYISVAFYILRSVLFSLCADKKQPIFSIDKLSTHFQDAEISLIHRKIKTCSSFETFLAIKNRIKHYLGLQANEYRNLESFILSLEGENSLAYILGLKLLGKAGDVLPYNIHIG